MKTVRLTKRGIDGLKASKEREFHFDAEVRGFGIIVYRTGKKSFFVQWGNAKTRQRMKLGDYGILTLDSARDKARAVLVEVNDGANPADERKKARTWGDWIDEYLRMRETRVKSVRNDKRYLGIASKRWKNRLLSEINPGDVKRIFQSITQDGHTTDANRWLASVRSCLQEAWRMELVPSNPAMKVKPNPEGQPRTRTLTDEELQRLGTAILELDDPAVKAAFVLLLNTGARLSEVLRSRWEDIDFEGSSWTIPRTKSNRSQTIPLVSDVVSFLSAIPREGPFVVTSPRNPLTHRHDLKKPWEGLKRTARIEGATIHDLRRTFGKRLAQTAGLHIASKLLRHSDIRVTERHYAPLGLEDLRPSLEGARGQLLIFPKAK